MTERVTMRDLARAAGVSPMTVSRALRNDGTVSEKTRAQIRALADKLGYVYDSTAQAFRTQRSQFLAVTLPSLNNANFAATHRGLAQALAGSGFQILLGVTDYDMAEEERLVRELLSRRPDALILTGGAHTEGARQLLANRALPVMEIWDLPLAPLGHVVGFSNRSAMGAMVRHLAERGRRRLAFLGATGDTDRRGAERFRGAVEAAEAIGLSEITYLDAGPAPISMTEGAKAIEALGPKIHQFDALLAVSDPVAFGALTALKRAGVDVPGEIALTGFGAFEIAAISSPRLTTIDVSAETIGRRAGEIVREVLAGTGPSDPIRVETGVRLLVGETS